MMMTMMKLLERMYQTLYNSAHQQQVISIGHSQKLKTVAILFSLGWQPFRKPVNFVERKVSYCINTECLK